VYDYSRSEINESNSDSTHALSSDLIHTGKAGECFLVEVFSVRRDGIWFSVATNKNGKLVACAFSDRNRLEAERGLGGSLGKNFRSLRRRRVDSKSLHALTSFYEGKGKRTKLSMVDLTSVSDFRKGVYRLLCKIPRGKVTTYGAMARKLGGKRYARAVGTAVATNPLPLIIPCHRVVPVSLRVGNYGMCGRSPTTGGYMKRMLLEREGVRFQSDRVTKRSIWTPK
jgi:methylated-DNA-[protein]-cysteine S-methyltransferase